MQGGERERDRERQVKGERGDKAVGCGTCSRCSHWAAAPTVPLGRHVGGQRVPYLTQANTNANGNCVLATTSW